MNTKLFTLTIVSLVIFLMIGGDLTGGVKSDENMILVKGGTFKMGSTDLGPNDDEPIHDVRLNSFLIGKCEVSQKQWKAVMGNSPSLFVGEDLPVENVNYYDAVEYCNKRSQQEGLTPCYTGTGDAIVCNFEADGYRLPTEAEWEFAARGGNKSANYVYSGSNIPEEVAWFELNSGLKTNPVGKKKSNELGIYDMSGNIWEWCEDWYDENYYKTSPVDNPHGPEKGKLRSYRGGGGNGRPFFLRTTARFNLPSGHGRFDMGFRVVRKPAEKIPEDLVMVEGGTFKMGTSNGGNGERIIHPVTVKDFYIAQFEVTQEEWNRLMPFDPAAILGAKCPVDNVTWLDVVEYCNRLSLKEGFTPCYKIDGLKVTCNFDANGYRLPTEAEWEYAYRGGAQSGNFTFSGSNNADEVGFYEKNSGYLPQAVGQKKPNELGIRDMTGSVREFCWDWFDREYYLNSPSDNPKGPANGIYRVVRGGSIYDPELILHYAYREPWKPFRGRTGIGFRVVRTAK